MASGFNLLLTDELRSFVDKRVNSHKAYATASEYIQDLIRQDMKNHHIVKHVSEGLDDIKNNKLSKHAILDIALDIVKED